MTERTYLDDRSLRVGAAKVSITPPVGIAMGGYGARRGVSQGVHDALEARALVASAGGDRIAVVLCDLVSLDVDTLRRVRERAAQVTDIPPDHLLVAVTHTHSGPAYASLVARYLSGLPAAAGDVRFPDWEAELPERNVGAVQQAAKHLVPARLAVGTAQARVGVHRRLPDALGGVRLHPNPDGPIDPDITALRFDDLTGRAIATLVQHACHPVVLCEDNLQLSGDFPHVVRGALETSGHGLTLYASGACGNINPRRRGDFEAARAIGEEIARAAAQALVGAERTRPDVVAGARTTVPLRLKAMAQMSAADRYLAAAEHALEGHADPDNFEGRRLREEVLRARQQERRLRSLFQRADALGAADGRIDATVQALRIGPVVLLGLPGEVFVELGQALKRRVPWAQRVVMGYANEPIGYVPTAAAYGEGGYEVESALIASGGGEAIVDAAVALADAVAR
jgi:hypothetical protein